MKKESNFACSYLQMVMLNICKKLIIGDVLCLKGGSKGASIYYSFHAIILGLNGICIIYFIVGKQ